jgi:hypothetical protein
MSTNLYWQPVDPETRPLSDALKYLIVNEIWPDCDGSVDCEPKFIGSEFIPFLHGIIVATADCEVLKSAKILVEAITKYGMVEISIER